MRTCFVVASTAALGQDLYAVEGAARDGGLPVRIELYGPNPPQPDEEVHVAVNERGTEEEPMAVLLCEMNGTVALAEGGRTLLSHGGLVCSLPMSQDLELGADVRTVVRVGGVPLTKRARGVRHR